MGDLRSTVLKWRFILTRLVSSSSMITGVVFGNNEIRSFYNSGVQYSNTVADFTLLTI